jgi:thioredoxin-related protein
MLSMNKVIASIALAVALLLADTTAQAKVPDGWPFVEFNEAVQISKRQKKPMFVYFGFATCPYCIYLNDHAFADEALRKRYTANYVLAYFDIRGNPDDVITLPGSEQLTRAEAIKRFRGSPVPAWMFVDPEGKTIMLRRGSRTSVHSFMTYDLYVASGAYKRMAFEEFLERRGQREDGEK